MMDLVPIKNNKVLCFFCNKPIDIKHQGYQNYDGKAFLHDDSFYARKLGKKETCLREWQKSKPQNERAIELSKIMGTYELYWAPCGKLWDDHEIRGRCVGPGLCNAK